MSRYDALVDVSADLHESLRALEAERRVRDNIEDRALAETLRKDGYDDARLKERFGYVPTRIERKSRERSLAAILEGRVERKGARTAIRDPEPNVRNSGSLREAAPQRLDKAKTSKVFRRIPPAKSGLG